MSQQSLSPEQIEQMRNAARLRYQADGIRRAQQARNAPKKPLPPGHAVMSATSNDFEIPVIEDDDVYFLDISGAPPPFHMTPKPEYFDDYERACRDDEAATMQHIIEHNSLTPAVLHHGLTLALAAGSVSCVQELLLRGSPIAHRAPERVLSAPEDKRIALLDALVAHGGWKPSHDIFMRAIPDLEMLSWFLSHGINPNHGKTHLGQPSQQSAGALEKAAWAGSAEAIEALIAAGAKVAYGTPLHSAASAIPPDQVERRSDIVQTEDFDTSRIPAMAALVAHGADVNQKDDLTHVNSEGYPLVYAVRAGAPRRARWLLEHGADPHLKGDYGSAADYALKMGSEEMKEVFRPYQRSESG